MSGVDWGLSGRRVVVTGGSRGIGAACCRFFAGAGAAVLVQYRAEQEKAASLLAELDELRAGPKLGQGPKLETTAPAPGKEAPASGGLPARHLMHRCDLREERAVGELFAVVEAAWGGLDVLVNNAGIWVENPLACFDAARMRETLEVNLVGPFLCAAAALPLLARSADGAIVNVASTAGQRGEPYYSPYAASKGALIAATRSWSGELAPRVRVNCVAPGWVVTDMTAEALRERQEAVVEAIPLGRIASPEDIAGSVLFLASRLARHITGAVVSVNGGSVLA
ncbi:MAG TPA: SDR family oxidoreductase [Thermoanaerobaculia bacterium]|nr:SDR family oxidoreductase [Thermoanaerobaculia bacterium]